MEEPVLVSIALVLLHLLLNLARLDAGLPALEVCEDQQANAQRRAQLMADEGRMHHAADLTHGSADGELYGENVGWDQGADLVDLHDAMVNSPTHRANRLGDWTCYGLGVVIDDDGTLWLVERYRR